MNIEVMKEIILKGTDFQGALWKYATQNNVIKLFVY